MKKILSSFLLISILILSFPNQGHAFSFYSERNNNSSEGALSLISNQTFDTNMSIDNAKGIINHFVENTESYDKVPNSDNMKSYASDGTYTIELGWSSKGCFHYADFVTVTMYGEPSRLSGKRYIDQEIGSITPEGLKAFLQKYAQAGEHLRLDNRHSLSFISSSDTGFYTLQYYGDNSDPFLSFSTYEYFANLLNSIGKDFWIFESDRAVNYIDSETELEPEPEEEAEEDVEEAKTGWVKESRQWFFINPDGELARGWIKDGGKWYYLDSDGVMQTGWIKDGGKWYYLLGGGAMKTGWYNSYGKWYYLNPSGAMKTGWLDNGGKWYYLLSSGVMQTGWTKVSNKWYYMSSSGAMQTGWIEEGGKSYFLNEDGSWLSNSKMNANVFGKSNIRALVNKNHSIGSYRPSDLVRVNVPTVKGNTEENLMRREAANKLNEMFSSAKESGLTLYARSGFRSYSTQRQLFQRYTSSYGQAAANRFSARSGQSEHQTGLAMDVTCASVNYQLTVRFGQTPEGIWLRDNAHKFGFIIRYPQGKEAITGYKYEPWHIRYIGVCWANEVYKSGLTYEEFLMNIGYNI